MSARVPYDDLAEIYDAWAAHHSDPAMDQNRAFYVREYVATDGPVVELGVGNGRILIAAARLGKAVIGVDSSARMLDLCRRSAAEAGVAGRVRLIQGDFRDFVLPEPASLIAIPYDSIGHLVTREGKRACIEHVLGELRPGGRFLLDHRIFSPQSAANDDRKPRLQFTYMDPDSGREVLLWSVAIQNFPEQCWRSFVFIDTVGDKGVMTRRLIGSVSNSWIGPDELRQLLVGAGLQIDACLGDFDGGPFTPDSRQQIWMARRPLP
ncbi:MAG TPA: class I SAM-dependent methyltransferase [Gemmataceae bacterium]|nr:class I SAM-dependent methyltransferase [Gemmataceae bacterium]